MRSSYPIHPAANILPRMSDDQVQELANDIKLHGLREPIRLLDGQVIDGRHRLDACKIAGVEPAFVNVDAIDDPIEYVISLNIHRRHLTSAQRALLAAKIEGKKIGSNQHAEGMQKCRPSTATLATLFGVCPRLIADARKVLRSGRERLIAAVENGNESVSSVARALEAEQKVERSLLALGETLMCIRDEMLFRDTHGTFEAYCTSWAESHGDCVELVKAAINRADRHRSRAKAAAEHARQTKEGQANG